MEKDKPKKKKSLSSKIKDLRERLKYSDSAYWRILDNRKKLADELEEYRKLLPTKYYVISYSILNNDKITVNYKVTIESPTLTFAINKLKVNKTHPDSIKILDVKVFE